jgi:acyl-ACP thioesterase
MDPLRATFDVHTYEADAFGLLAVPALAGFLSEAAGRHAVALGAGIDALGKRGFTWVLARHRIEIATPIRLRDSIVVETWPSGVERLAALRDFVVRRSDGVELARSISQWLVMDVTTRRAVRPEGVLPPERFVEAPHAASFAPGKLPALERWERQQRFHVRYADIDVNLHANHCSYLAWAIEAVPQEVWQSSRLAVLEVQYLAECRHGSAILSRLASTGDGAYAHAIVREDDGKELARVATGWVER